MLHIKFQTSKDSGSEEEIFDKKYFYGLNLGSPAVGHLAVRDLRLNKLGKRLLGNATYQISSIHLSRSEEEDFLISFYITSLV